MSSKHHRHGKPGWVWQEEQDVGRYYAALDVIRSLTGAWERWLVPR